jgi:SAM-dependent methyltransferase
MRYLKRYLKFPSVEMPIHQHTAFAMCQKIAGSPIIEGDDSGRDFEILFGGSPRGIELEFFEPEYLKKFKVTCVDRKPSKKSEAPEGARVEIIGCDVFKWEPGTLFDAVANRWFLHHLTDKQTQKFLTKSFSLLKPGGRFVAADFFFRDFTGRDDRFAALREHYVLDEERANMGTKHYDIVRNLNAESYDRQVSRRDFKGMKNCCVSQIRDMMKISGFVNIQSEPVQHQKDKAPGLYGSDSYVMWGDRP